jgi:hypothetical protein
LYLSLGVKNTDKEWNMNILHLAGRQMYTTDVVVDGCGVLR